MPGKSKHGKGKHPHHSKKSRAIHRQEVMASRQHGNVVAPKPAAVIEPPSGLKGAALPAKRTTLQYPYIAGELRRIGILAGVIVIILIALSFVLS